MDAMNVLQVFDEVWSSGQISAQDIERLPEMGVEVVINLALPSSSNALAGEAEKVAALGLSYIHIPVLWERPELDKLAQFFAVMRAMRGRKIWVHCAMNKRVSVFLYLYRRIGLHHAESRAARSLAEIWAPDAVWLSFIEEALAAAQAGRFDQI